MVGLLVMAGTSWTVGSVRAEDPRARAKPAASQPASAQAQQGAASAEGDGAATTRPARDPSVPVYEFRLKPQADETVYYLIENEYRDSGGVPPLLSYSVIVRDRLSVVQTRYEPGEGQPIPPTPEGYVNLQWEVDRYEVREKGMEDELWFDSLRHLYPPPSLRDLGRAPDTRLTYSIDPETGKVVNLRITPGAYEGPPAGRNKMSKTAKNARLTADHVDRLLRDMGAFYFPPHAVAEGEQWSRLEQEKAKTFGTLFTQLTFTLERVERRNDRELAHIHISGDLSLRPDEKAKIHNRAVQPRQSKEEKEFRLVKGICSGKAAFDLTRGELVTLEMHRETEYVAEFKSEGQANMLGISQIRQGSAHDLRIKSSRRPPPKPLMVGEKTAPPMSEKEKERMQQAAKRPTNRAVATTTRPAHVRVPTPSTQPTTQPASQQAPWVRNDAKRQPENLSQVDEEKLTPQERAQRNRDRADLEQRKRMMRRRKVNDPKEGVRRSDGAIRVEVDAKNRDKGKNQAATTQPADGESAAEQDD